MNLFFNIIGILLSFQAIIGTPKDYFRQGMEQYQMRQFDSSLYYFNCAIALDSTFHEAIFRRALVKAKMNDLEEAYKDYSMAISISQEPKYYNNRGINLAIRNHMQEAIKDYDQALALDSTYAQAYLNKGVALNYLGDTEASCQNFQKAYELGLTMARQFLIENCSYELNE